MSELRGYGDDQPVETPQSRAERIKELTALGDAKAMDPSVRVYDPTEHVAKREEPREERPAVISEEGDRPTLRGLTNKIHATNEARESDAERLADKVDEGDRPRAWKTIAEEEGEVRSFPSFSSAKRALGGVEGTELHHIVEQRQEHASGFSRERINTTDNLTRISEPIHKEVSRFFSTRPPGFDQVVRFTQDGEPWEAQHAFGSRVLDRVFEEAEDDDD